VAERERPGTTVPVNEGVDVSGRGNAPGEGERTTVSDQDEPETIEHGHAGASARAEYERRQARDEARRRARFGRLAPAVRLLVGPKASTEAWASGAVGEERVGHLLDQVVGDTGVVLHDRRVPGRRINLDHLVVVTSGVWVIDTKHYHGRLARRQVGGWFTPREVLTVGRRNESRLVSSANQQRAIVEQALREGVPLRAVLCFTGVELGLFARPFVMEGVVITWPKALAKSLGAPGALTESSRSEVADRLIRAFPSYRR
jgi:Nuclease-related domain